MATVRQKIKKDGENVLIKLNTNELLILTRILIIILSWIIIFGIQIYLEIRPDKETRERIREIAKEKRMPRYIVVKKILKMYFMFQDEILKRRIRIESNDENYEQWKTNYLKEQMNNQVAATPKTEIEK